MRSSNPPLHVFVEVVELELVGICIDELGNEDFYGFVGIHVGHLLGCIKFLLELGFEVFKSMNTCGVLGNPLNFLSCVYVWVMNHLGVVLGDAFGLFWSFWLDFGKKVRNQQIWAIFGVLCRSVGIPCSSVGPR